jgi:type I restriction enzyme S subunit
VALVRPDPDQVDSRYLLYFFLSRAWRQVIESNVITGATVDRVPLEKFPTFLAALPRLRVQQHIADILYAYDELIDNNRRRMALLEQAARQLYCEWFVRLRFPGYEHIPITNGIPEGWERRPLECCADFLSGGTPSKARNDYWDGNIPWVSSGELTTMRVQETSLNITAEAVQAGSRMVPTGTILVVVRGMSLAKEFRMSVTARQVAFNQDLKALIAKPDVDANYLFHALETQRDQIRDRAGEASHGTKKLETAVLASVPILLPPNHLQHHFRDFVVLSNAQWDNLYKQNQKLRAARDLLLPRLMSGEIAV